MKNQLKIIYLFFILIIFSCDNSQSQEVIIPKLETGLRASGKKIVNDENEEVLLRGVNVGQWLLMEGFMSGSNGSMSQSAMKRKLYSSGKSRAQIEVYFDKYRANFITKSDIDFIASKGYNCIRVPLHYELFLTDEQRDKRLDVVYSNGAAKETAYNTYKDNLQSWVTNNTLATPQTLMVFKLLTI